MGACGGDGDGDEGGKGTKRKCEREERGEEGEGGKHKRTREPMEKEVVQGLLRQGFVDDGRNHELTERDTTTMRPAKPAVSTKAYELRTKSKADLETQLKELKAELNALRVAKVTNGAPNKLSKIKDVRLGIARVLTVMSQQKKQALRDVYKGKKYLPLDLRPKKTRAIRRRLTPSQANAKTVKQKKKETYFPQRKYAVRA